MIKKISTHLSLVFPIVLIATALVLAGLQFSGSSIGMYHRYFYGDAPDPDLIAGEPRAIRSDEWLVNTPWLFIQEQSGFPVETTTVAGSIFPGLSSFAVLDWTIIFKPFYWPIMLLKMEYGFPLYWWLRLAGLILAFYSCLLIVTKNKVLPSILLSLALFFAPYIQWWLSQLLVEILAYALFGMAAFFCLFASDSRKKELIFGLGFAYFGIATALSLYPPFQIPLVLFLGFLAVAYLVQKYRGLSRPIFMRKLGTLGIAVLLVLGVLAVFFLQFQDQIYTYTHTVYPGQRRVLGGGISWKYLLSGPFDMQLQDDRLALPVDFANQSEGAMYFLPALLSLPILAIYPFTRRIKSRTIDLVWASALLFTLLGVSWLFVSFPDWLVRWLPLQFVPPRRFLFVFGVVDLFFAAWFIYREAPIRNWRVWLPISIFYAVLIYLLYLKFGFDLRQNNPMFIQSTLKIHFIAAAMGGLVLLILTQRKGLYPAALLVFSLISTVGVNPIYRGIDILTNTDLSAYIQTVAANSETKNARWAVYDSIILGNYVAANGGSVINGTVIYPNVPFWSAFDPEQKYSDVYNRYAHVGLEIPATESEENVFKLAAGDHFTILIDPCSSTLETLNVQYFIFLRPVTRTCLNFETKIDFPNMPVYIYSRNLMGQ